MGLKEAADYAIELKKAEKAKEVRSRAGSGRPGTAMCFIIRSFFLILLFLLS